MDSLVPGSVTLGKGFIEEFPLRLVIRSALNDYARHWDLMAARTPNWLHIYVSRGDPGLNDLKVAERAGTPEVEQVLADTQVAGTGSLPAGDAPQLVLDASAHP